MVFKRLLSTVFKQQKISREELNQELVSALKDILVVIKGQGHFQAS